MNPLDTCPTCGKFNVNCEGHETEPVQCGQWVMMDHRCTRKATKTIVLPKPVDISGVSGTSMWGTYAPGEWHFCTQHAKAFIKAQGAS